MSKIESLKRKTKEFKRLVAPVIVVTLAVLSFVQLYFSFFVFRQTNDECLWMPEYIKADSVRISFYDVKPNGVTWNAGIRDGDTLLAVEGEPIRSVSQLSKKLAQKKEGEFVYYQMKRGDSLFIADVKVKKLLSIRSLTIELFALIWLIVGFIVYASKPEGEIQNKFFNIGILWTLSNNSIFSDASQYLLSVNETLISTLNWTWVLSDAFLPPAILSFFLSFPEKKSFAKKKIARALYYGYPIAAILGYLILKYYVKPPNIDLQNFAEVGYYAISVLAIFATLLAGFVSLAVSYRKIKDERKRKPLKIILYSYAVSLLSLVYLYFLARIVVGSFYNHPHYYLPVVLYAVLPIAFGYTIFKYSLMDASSVVKNAFLYFIASLMIAGIYFFSIVIIGGSLVQAVAPVYQGLIINLLFVLFVILFLSTKDKFQDAITKRFYPEQLAFREILIKFSREIPSVHSFDGVLDETMKIFTEALKINVFAIGLKSENSLVVEIKRAAGLTNAEKMKLKLKSENCEEIKNGKKERSDFCLEPEEFHKVFENPELLKKNEIQTVLPLTVRGKLIGFLFFGVKRSGARFGKEDVSVLTAASSQVAVALENARMYEAEKKEIILRRDLEKARLIQRGLLPGKMPEFPRAEIFGEMIPARWVGGDYYDVIKIDDDRFYAIIGDVSGKGFAASFYMSKLQTMIRMLADEKPHPAAMLKTLNRKIYGALEKNYFITLSILLFDFKEDVAYYSRAGHTPLKLYCCGKAENFSPNGIAVGLNEGDLFDENIEELTISLKSGQIFVLYSDGISEEMNEAGELLGDEFLNGVLVNNANLPLNEIWEKTIAEIRNFQSEKGQHDDITCLFVKIK